MAFNWFDELRTGYTQKWISMLNASYIEGNGPTIKVFKLDKKVTPLDPIYGEANSRIYLPPFEIRSIHLVNPWKQIIGEQGTPYQETEENLQFIVNFDNMVKIIRDLKNSHVSDISISYIGITGEPSAVKSNGILSLKINSGVVASFDLNSSTYNTTQKVSNAINSTPNFRATFTGKNDSSINLVDFEEVRFKSYNLIIYSPNLTYANITEVIEKGDVILTHSWKLYEVLANLPGGNIGWDYATFVLSCNTIGLDEAELPGDYDTQIRSHQYGLTDRINME
jgi:hypothetical protein